MTFHFLLVLFSQVIIPELAPPETLDAPSERPAVVPLGYDTLGVEVFLSTRLGFDFTARRDAARFAGRTSLGMFERRDHFEGAEQRAKIDLASTFNQMQVVAEVEAVGFQSTHISREKTYGIAALSSFWQAPDFLIELLAQGYRSRMQEESGDGLILKSRFLIPRDRTRFLARVRGSMESAGDAVVTDCFIQHQWGSILLTPNIQARLPLGASAGLNVLALLGNLALEFDGCYRRFQPILLDSILIEPINAAIAYSTEPWLIQDRLSMGLGYKGVQVEIFAVNGDHLYWQVSSDSSIPVIGPRDFFQGGAEVKVELERKDISNQTVLRLFAFDPGDTWIPLWSFSDSLALQLEPWGGFISLKAQSERSTGQVTSEPYVLVGVGVFYEREPLRVILSADDLLDRRPSRWPGLREPGRRVSLSCAFFSNRW